MVFLSIIFWILYSYRYAIGHWTRPLWDTPDPPWEYITNFGYKGSQSCSLHGMKERTSKVRVFDTFLFDIEMDMLEIRLNELDGVVDYFVLVESPLSFTYHPKAMMYDKNKDSPTLAKFKDKIIHVKINETELKETKLNKGFGIENWQRAHIYKGLLQCGSGCQALGIIPIQSGDLVIVADVDEIPRANTIALLKNCEGFNSPIHLQTKIYFYSFEFSVEHEYEHVTSVWTYAENVHFTGHRRKSSIAIADAGWHCTFCFRYIEDFVHKMESYSHWDRALPQHKQVEKIREKVCQGIHLYDRYNYEVYYYRDMYWSLLPFHKELSVIGLPEYLLNNPQKFEYLLPGGCHRHSKH